MSMEMLKAGLNGRIGRNLIPNRWLTELLMSWCREVAKHEDGTLDPAEDDELFNLMNSVIELLLEQDADRLNHFRENRASLFEPLACELDEIIRKELLFRVIDYDVDRKTRRDLFRDHFPTGLGQETHVEEVDQSRAAAVQPGPT